MVDFFPLNELATQFPAPKVPVLPVLGASFWRRGSTPIVSRFFDPDVVFLRNGRSAIAHALVAAGIGQGDEVLLPAYHCGSMVEPFVWAGALIRFYRIHEDLSVDIEDIKRLITPRTKALLATHYFGFPQDFPAIKKAIAPYDIALLEDCAHALFSVGTNPYFGTFGDYSIASLAKFAPIENGGALCKNGDAPLSLTLRPRSPVVELKELYLSLHDATRYGRLPWLRPLIGLYDLLTEVRPTSSDSDEARPEPDQQDQTPARFHWFAKEDMNQPAALMARYVSCRLQNSDTVIVRRRNFRRLLEACEHLKSVTPLFNKLPDVTAPYMFPLLLDQPVKHFAELKMRGVPLWRWEELVTTTNCPISLDYRLRLVQVPCHEELQESEIVWLIEQLTDVLGSQ